MHKEHTSEEEEKTDRERKRGGAKEEEQERRGRRTKGTKKKKKARGCRKERRKRQRWSREVAGAEALCVVLCEVYLLSLLSAKSTILLFCARSAIRCNVAIQSFISAVFAACMK